MQSAEQPHTSIRHIQGIFKIHAYKKTSPGKRFNARGEDECFLGGEQK